MAPDARTHALLERQMSLEAARREAFTQFYRENYQRVYAFMLARTGRKEDAEDLTQRVFLRLFQTYQPTTADDLEVVQRQWQRTLWPTAHNVLTDYYRAKGVRAATGSLTVDVNGEPVEQQVPDPEMGPTEVAQDDAFVKAYNQCEAKLPEDQRRAWQLKQQGLKEVEIGARLMPMDLTDPALSAEDLETRRSQCREWTKYRITLARRALQACLRKDEWL